MLVLEEGSSRARCLRQVGVGEHVGPCSWLQHPGRSKDTGMAPRLAGPQGSEEERAHNQKPQARKGKCERS